jgi:hypothetical protein
MHPETRRVCAAVSGLGAVALALAVPRVAAEEPLGLSTPELRLVWVDLADTGPASIEGAALVVQRLLEPLGVRVSGEIIRGGGEIPSEGMRVILMAFDPTRPDGKRPVAGEARRDSGSQRAVWILPRIVAGGLGLDLTRRYSWPPVSQLHFQRALAVVVVHELAHALAGASHRPTGLMSTKLGQVGLLSPRLTLDADLAPAFLEGVARLEAETADRALADATLADAASPKP